MERGRIHKLDYDRIEKEQIFVTLCGIKGAKAANLWVNAGVNVNCKTCRKKLEKRDKDVNNKNR